MSTELTKYKSIINICSKFITSLKQRYNNINTQQYIIERLIIYLIGLMNQEIIT